MTTHEIISAINAPPGVMLKILWKNTGETTEDFYQLEAAKALGWKHPDPQPVDPAWMVEVSREGCAIDAGEMDGGEVAVAYRAGRNDDTAAYRSSTNALRLALSRGHVVLAPVMPSDDFVSEDDPLFNPIWDVIKGWDIGGLAKYGGCCGATGNHVRAIIRAVRSAAPVMPSEEEMLRDAREDAAQVNDGRYPDTAASMRAGDADGNDEVKSALQARRNVYASLRAVKAVPSGPVVPEVDLREVASRAWDAGLHSAEMLILAARKGSLQDRTDDIREADISAIIGNLKSGEA